MHILITGASGFIGKALILQLTKAGHTLTLLSRRPDLLQDRYGDMHRYYHWDCLLGPPPKDCFQSIDAIINLMGEGVAEKRWSKKQKKRLYDTRVLGTKHLVAGAIQHAPNLSVFITTSAIGYYDHTHEQDKSITSPCGTHFLSQLCRDWEQAAMSIKDLPHVRTVCLRIGVVLGEGGALSKMKWPFILGLGAVLGSGKQWMNWIHHEDIVRLLIYALDNHKMSGTFNGVSPGNVTNRTFTKILGKILRRPTLFRIPSFMMKLLLGELSTEVLYGQRVTATCVEGSGFTFHYNDISAALEKSLGIHFIPHLNHTVRCQRFHDFQYLPYSQEAVFSFFSDAYNLEKITPPYLKFHVLSQSTETIQKGTLLNYRLRLRGIPIGWQTLIEKWMPPNSFIDTQLKGPYKVWRHTHTFTSAYKGTLIEDEVYYALPSIPFLSFIVSPFVRKDVRDIFLFRKHSISKLLL